MPVIYEALGLPLEHWGEYKSLTGAANKTRGSKWKAFIEKIRADLRTRVPPNYEAPAHAQGTEDNLALWRSWVQTQRPAGRAGAWKIGTGWGAQNDTNRSGQQMGSHHISGFDQALILGGTERYAEPTVLRQAMRDDSAAASVPRWRVAGGPPLNAYDYILTVLPSWPGDASAATVPGELARRLILAVETGPDGGDPAAVAAAAPAPPPAHRGSRPDDI